MAGGGVFFLDEAYQLASGNSFGGAAVLDFLLAEIEEQVGKIVFILAGYSKEMEKFLERNPGFSSRIPHRLNFPDYMDKELLIMLGHLVESKYSGRAKIEDGLNGLYARILIQRLGRGRGAEGYGNARALENLWARITERQANRLHQERISGANPDDFLFTKEDLIGPEPLGAFQQSTAWKELQSLIGLHDVKQSVMALVNCIRLNYQRELYEKPPVEVSLNRIFLGSPGTGKTTVGKLYALILADLGLLSKREGKNSAPFSTVSISCSKLDYVDNSLLGLTARTNSKLTPIPVVFKNPADFVGSALGESEKNTKEILKATEGKVLIIDEAYMLYPGCKGGGHVDPYKAAVIDTIVSDIQSTPGEDRCVLLLGYKDQMEEMLENSNPGLARRFPMNHAFHFEDFNDEELRAILDLKLKKQGLEATEKAKAVAIELLSRARDRPNFGNAGEVENLISHAKESQQKRSLSTDSTSCGPDIVFLPQDFDENFDRARNSAVSCRRIFADIVGCENLINRLEGYQRTAASMRARKRDPREQIPLNFIFKGPPGKLL
jgi:AAA lid domain/ATPase family associated with various cellular activities (AAA)